MAQHLLHPFHPLDKVHSVDQLSRLMLSRLEHCRTSPTKPEQILFVVRLNHLYLSLWSEKLPLQIEAGVLFVKVSPLQMHNHIGDFAPPQLQLVLND